MKNRKNALLIIIAIPSSVAVMISCTHQGNTTATTVSFNKDLIPIFTTSCSIGNNCHSGPANSGDNMNFDSNAVYNTIISKSLINIANPTASLLYVEINSGTMPKAPYSKLSPARINLILNWIKQGGKNN